MGRWNRLSAFTVFPMEKCVRFENPPPKIDYVRIYKGTTVKFLLGGVKGQGFGFCLGVCVHGVWRCSSHVSWGTPVSLKQSKDVQIGISKLPVPCSGLAPRPGCTVPHLLPRVPWDKKGSCDPVQDKRHKE